MAEDGITLCMIARDEAGCIADAIRSCAGVVSDVVVVDTGSTDGTMDVARSLGARVFQQAWEDSFSKPRNYAWDQVKTKWMMVLDCDERLRKESGALVLEACKSQTVEGFIVSVMVHTATGVTPTRACRLGRADLGHRFRNRIHEKIFPESKALAGTQIVIDHLGYLLKPRQAKAGLYNRLLEMDAEDRPTDNALMINLVHNYWSVSDPRWEQYMPRAVATLARDSAKAPNGLAAVLLEIILLLPAEKVPAELTQAQADELAERWFPGSLPLLLDRAKWRLQSGRKREGRDIARRALGLWESKTFKADVAFNPGPVLADLQRISQMVCE